jgi:hypothetical protein
MCVLILSKTFVRNTSHSKNNSAKYFYTYAQVFSYSTRYSRYILKILSANFMKIRLVGAELFHTDERTDRQTDRQDETNSRIS